MFSHLGARCEKRIPIWFFFFVFFYSALRRKNLVSFFVVVVVVEKANKKQNKRKNGARWNLARGNQVMRFYKKDIPINDCRPKISMIMKRNHGRINEKLGGNRKPSKKPVKPNKTQ